MNPIFTQVIYNTVKNAMKRCPHCKKSGTYPPKKAGQFYTCKYCQHRFKEKG